MKFCKDCDHCLVTKTQWGETKQCKHEDAREPVNGEAESCDTMRYDSKKCGLDGKWWKAKVPTAPNPYTTGVD